MAKNDDPQNTELEPIEISPEQLRIVREASRELSVQLQGDAVRFDEVSSEIGVAKETLPLETLENVEVTIVGMRPFPSKYAEQDYALYCLIYLPDDDTLYGTVIGGGVMIEKLRRYAQSGINRPLVIIPFKAQGGLRDWYWDFR